MADGYRYYLDAGGKLLNTDVPLPAGYYLDEQGRLIDGNTYGNEIVIDTGSAADPSRTPLAGLRDQLHLGEADINNAAELFDVNRTMFSANYDKWDLYNACFLEVPENRALLYMLSGEVPTGGVFVDTKSQFAADTMEQTADALRGFLNSFDWKNASEMERAKKALDFCRQAQYDWDTFIGKNSVTDPGHIMPFDNPFGRSHSIVGCVRDKLCVCEGYANAYAVLCRMMGMEVLYAVDWEADHAFNFVKVDGVWYTVDGTGGDWFKRPATEEKNGVMITGKIAKYNQNDYMEAHYIDPAQRERVWSLIR